MNSICPGTSCFSHPLRRQRRTEGSGNPDIFDYIGFPACGGQAAFAISPDFQTDIN